MGRAEFETVVASAPRVNMIQFSRTNSTAVATGVTETVYFYAPVGSICEVVGAYLWGAAPTGAISGDHSGYFAFDSPIMDISTGISNYNKDLNFNNSYWQIADKVVYPNTAEAQGQAVRSINFDSVTPLRMSYLNNTNVSTSQSRQYRLWTKKITTV